MTSADHWHTASVTARGVSYCRYCLLVLSPGAHPGKRLWVHRDAVCPATRRPHDWAHVGVHVQCPDCSTVCCCSTAHRNKRMDGPARRRVIDRLVTCNGGRCWWCGVALDLSPEATTAKPIPSNMATVDHVVTRRAGGSNRLLNLVAACYCCNARRGDMPAGAWEESPQLHARRVQVMRAELKAMGRRSDGRGWLHLGKFEFDEASLRCPTCGRTSPLKPGPGGERIWDYPCSADG